jgi:hypothetical protein
MLECVARGVDLFDSDYATLLTEAGCAASFRYDYERERGAGAGASAAAGAAAAAEEDWPEDVRDEDAAGDDAEDTAAGSAVAIAPAAPGAAARAGDAMPEPEAEPGAEPGEDRRRKKAAKVASSSGAPSVAADAAAAERSRLVLAADPLPRLRLAARRFRDDERALVPGCACFACAGVGAAAAAALLPATKDARPLSHPGHMRCYLHHLVRGQELLGGVLLAAHNQHHLCRFFEAVRRSIDGGFFDKYVAWFEEANVRRLGRAAAAAAI